MISSELLKKTTRLSVKRDTRGKIMTGSKDLKCRLREYSKTLFKRTNAWELQSVIASTLKMMNQIFYYQNRENNHENEKWQISNQ